MRSITHACRPRCLATIALALALVGASLAGIALAEDGGRLRGEVKDANLRGVPGALVVASTREAPPVLAITTTTERGALSFDGLPEGLYDLLAVAEGAGLARAERIQIGGPYRAVVDLAAGPGGVETAWSVDVPMGSGEPVVDVRVVDEDGSFLAGVLVSADPVAHRADPAAVRTDRAGRATLGPLAPGRWSLLISRAGYQSLAVPRLAWPGGTLTVRARLLVAGASTPTPLRELMPAPRLLPPREITAGL